LLDVFIGSADVRKNIFVFLMIHS